MLKDHNAVTPVRLELAAPPSRVKHSTTEPLGSLTLIFSLYLMVPCKIVNLKDRITMNQQKNFANVHAVFVISLC